MRCPEGNANDWRAELLLGQLTDGRNEPGEIMKSHKSKMPIYGYRLAKRADAAEIFDVLEEVAPEIPVRLELPTERSYCSSASD
jgi:hypothetical protein